MRLVCWLAALRARRQVTRNFASNPSYTVRFASRLRTYNFRLMSTPAGPSYTSDTSAADAAASQSIESTSSTAAAPARDALGLDPQEAPPYPPEYSWETKNAVFTLFGTRRGKLARLLTKECFTDTTLKSIVSNRSDNARKAFSQSGSDALRAVGRAREHNEAVNQWLKENVTEPSDLYYRGPISLQTAPSLSLFDRPIKNYSSDIISVTESLWAQYHKATAPSERAQAQKRVDFLGDLLRHREYLNVCERQVGGGSSEGSGQVATLS